MKSISLKNLKRKSQSWRNYTANKMMANYLEKKECPIYSDETMLNRLEFTPPPEIPKYKKENIKQPNWIKNLTNNTLGQLLP